MHTAAVAAAALIGLATPAVAQVAGPPLEIAFCPAREVRIYPLESRAGVQGVLLQSVAVINRGPTEISLTGVDVDILRDGDPMETRRIGPSDLHDQGRFGEAPGPPAPGPGLPCPDWEGHREPGGAGPIRLAPGRAMFLFRQFLAFQGTGDHVRIRVRLGGGDAASTASAQIPIRAQMSKTSFRFPLRGAWWVGVAASPHTGHRWSIGEEFALDIGRLGGDGRDHRGSGSRFSHYYAYGAEVLAAADGLVVAAVDGVPEHPETMRRANENMAAYADRLRRMQARIADIGPSGLLGDYVVIDHGQGEYALYAHLQPGSVRVRPGERVPEGAVLGRLGSSGNSTAPHLHFQVCDGPDPLNCAGVPIRFKDLDLPWGDYPRPVQSGDLVLAP